MATAAQYTAQSIGLEPRKRSNRATRWIVTVALLIVGGQFLWHAAFKVELAKWFSAAASVALSRPVPGDLDESRLQQVVSQRNENALFWTNLAIKVDPTNPANYLARAQILAIDKRFQDALADCDRIVELSDSTLGFQMRIDIHQRMGDYAAAIADCDAAIQRLEQQLQETSEGQRELESVRITLAGQLNSRAYMSALGRLRLKDALADIDRAIELSEERWRIEALKGYELPERCSFIDTRAYLLLLLGELEEARAGIDTAVQIAEDHYRVALNTLGGLRELYVDPYEINVQLTQLRHTLAVLYHHRGEVHEAQGREEKAFRDKVEAIRLGYNPDQNIW